MGGHGMRLIRPVEQGGRRGARQGRLAALSPLAGSAEHMIPFCCRMPVGRIDQPGAHNQQTDSDLLTDNQPGRADQLTPGFLLKKAVLKMATVSLSDLPAGLAGKTGQQAA